MRKTITALLVLGLLATAASVNAQTAPKQPAKPAAKPAAKKPPTPEELARKAAEQQKKLEEETPKMLAALPDKAPAQPKKARKVLVYNLCKGFVHDSIPLGARTFEALGKKTGAFEATVTDDPQMFTAEKLQQFDAVLMNNTTGDNLPTPEQRKALVEFVKGGKGLIGIHAATDAFYKWPEYGEMMGGYFSGHPFSAITVKIDDPASPINAAFECKGFDIVDEIYTFRDPYSREKLHILLSLDWDKCDKAKQAGEKALAAKHWKARPDNDYALSWLRQYGAPGVDFAFGHQHPIFWNTAILKHYLAGIQYALGDLEANATPTVKAK